MISYHHQSQQCPACVAHAWMSLKACYQFWIQMPGRNLLQQLPDLPLLRLRSKKHSEWMLLSFFLSYKVGKFPESTQISEVKMWEKALCFDSKVLHFIFEHLAWPSIWTDKDCRKQHTGNREGCLDHELHFLDTYVDWFIPRAQPLGKGLFLQKRLRLSCQSLKIFLCYIILNISWEIYTQLLISRID